MIKRFSTVAASCVLTAAMVFGLAWAESRNRITPDVDPKCPIVRCPITKQVAECYVCLDACGRMVPLGNCSD
jgi:hypothetical protein